MNLENNEAVAIARIADAAREVLSASESLEEQAKDASNASAQTLSLARLTAAVNELHAARQALDELLTTKSMYGPRSR